MPIGKIICNLQARDNLYELALAEKIMCIVQLVSLAIHPTIHPPVDTISQLTEPNPIARSSRVLVVGLYATSRAQERWHYVA